MTAVGEIVRENIGKSSYDMMRFFQRMIKKGELEAYLVEVDREVIEMDTGDERVVRTKKGATLTPAQELREFQFYFIKDPETGSMYNLNIGIRGGMFSNYANSQTIYHHCVLEKLENFDSKKIARGGIDNEIVIIPEEMVSARLRINYDQDWESSEESDYVAGTSGSLVVEGEKDKLFDKVCEFVRKREK